MGGRKIVKFPGEFEWKRFIALKISRCSRNYSRLGFPSYQKFHQAWPHTFDRCTHARRQLCEKRERSTNSTFFATLECCYGRDKRYLSNHQNGLFSTHTVNFRGCVNGLQAFFSPNWVEMKKWICWLRILHLFSSKFL